MHRFLSLVSAAGLMACLALPSIAQQDSPLKISATSTAQGLSDWRHVQALPAKTNVHITMDRGGKTCRVFAVSDDTFTCAKGGNAAGEVIPRSQIQHIKLAHYGRSTLAGAGVGGGIGAIAGAIGGRTKPCATTQAFCLNGIGIGAGGVAAIFGVAGGVLGAAVGGPTDFARGSSIYVRP